MSLTKIINFNLTVVLTALGVFGAFCFVPTIPVLQNIICGLIVAFMRPIREGDYIDVGGEICEVTDMLLLKTKVRGKDGKILLLPNLSLVTGNIIKYTPGKFLRLTVNLDYKNDKDIEKVIDILNSICAENPNILPTPQRHKESLLDKYFEERERMEELTPQILITKITKEKVSLVLYFWTWKDVICKDEIIDSFDKDLTERAMKENIELL